MSRSKQKVMDDLQKLRSLEQRQDMYWEISNEFRQKSDALAPKINALTDRINKAVWDDIGEGDILTNGKQEVGVYLKIDPKDGNGADGYLYVTPDADIDGNRSKIYKGWLYLNGFASLNGWRKKLITPASKPEK